MPSPGGRIRALDGLRGIAIAIVIVGHLLRNRVHGPVHWLTVPFENPDLGVQVFFVLSGYLITSILVRERAKTGAISLRAFYARRAFRILPAYYAFLLIAVLLVAFGVFEATAGQLVSTFLFVSDYTPHDANWIEHTWSLAVEEQFYFLWPAVLVLAGNRRARIVAAIVVLALPVLRVANYALAPSTFSFEQFHNRADSLLIGAGLALTMNLAPAAVERARDAIARWRIVPFAVVFLVLTSYLGDLFGGHWTISIAWTCNGLAVVVLILAATAPTATARRLGFRPLVALGIISFSLYLWQQLFTLPDSKLPYALGVPLMLVIATASYLFIERPFLRLKDRYSRVRAAQEVPL